MYVLIRKALLPILRYFARKQVERRRRNALLSVQDLMALREMARPGDLIVTFSRWQPTNFVIPGHFNHVGMVVSEDAGIVEAVFPKVRKVDPISFLLGVDEFVIIRCTKLTDPQNAARMMVSFIGRDYDLGFLPDDDAFYCSEAVYTALLFGCDDDLEFELRKILGIYTIVPNDFYEVAKREREFTLIYDSRTKQKGDNSAPSQNTSQERDESGEGPQ